MTHTRWQSVGHPTGFKNKVSLPLLPTVHGLMETLIQACEHVWQRSSVQFMFCTCAEIKNIQGERRRAEGGKVFGGGSRAPVAITILVKNPNATHEGCKIQYRDIGDYLTREEKLETLHEKESISGFTDWETITPDKHNDWIGQRNEVFTTFYKLGTKETKAGEIDDTILSPIH